MNFDDLALLETRCNLARRQFRNVANTDYARSLRRVRWVERWREESVRDAWVKTRILA